MPMARETPTTPFGYRPNSDHPGHDTPDNPEPGSPPVEPDEGPASDRQRFTPPPGAQAPLSKAGLPLPHERDESVNPVNETPDPKMVQAKRDIDAGLVDTDMRATPGLDAQTRERMVPGPGGKPPSGS